MGGMDEIADMNWCEKWRMKLMKNEINREMNWERKVGKSIKGELKDGSIEGV